MRSSVNPSLYVHAYNEQFKAQCTRAILIVDPSNSYTCIRNDFHCFHIVQSEITKAAKANFH